VQKTAAAQAFLTVRINPDRFDGFVLSRYRGTPGRPVASSRVLRSRATPVCLAASGAARSSLGAPEPDRAYETGRDHHRSPDEQAWSQANLRHRDAVVDRADRLPEEKEGRVKCRRRTARTGCQFGDVDLDDPVQQIKRKAE